MKSQLFVLAHQLLKGGFFATFGEALKAAWLKVKCLLGLVSKVVYVKECGAERAGRIRRVSTAGREAVQVVAYFDEDVEGWRSFRLDRVLSWEGRK